MCCRAWGITPQEFDNQAAQGLISLTDMFLQIQLEWTDDVFEFCYPGTLEQEKQARIEAQNAAAFEAMFHTAQKTQQKSTGTLTNTKSEDHE